MSLISDLKVGLVGGLIAATGMTAVTGIQIATQETKQAKAVETEDSTRNLHKPITKAKP